MFAQLYHNAVGVGDALKEPWIPFIHAKEQYF